MLDESFYNQGCVNVDADLKEFKTSLQLHPHLREAIELALAIKRRVQTMPRWKDLLRRLGDDTANAVHLVCRFMAGISDEDLTQSTINDICKLKMTVEHVKAFVEAKSKPRPIILHIFRSSPLRKVQMHRDNLNDALKPFKIPTNIRMYGEIMNPNEEKPHRLQEPLDKSISHTPDEARAHIPPMFPHPVNAGLQTHLSPDTARASAPMRVAEVKGDYCTTTTNTTTHNTDSGNVNTTTIKDSFNTASGRAGGRARGARNR